MNISENLPLWAMHYSDPQTVFFLKIVAVAGLLSFLLNLKNISLAKLTLFLAFLILENKAYRNVPLFLFILFPILMENLNQWSGRLKELTSKIYFPHVNLLFFTVVLLFLSIRLTPVPDDGLDDLAPFRHPVQGTEFLSHQNIPGNLFNSVRQGGYIIWKLFPQKLSFIDGRMVLRSRNFFAGYLAVLDDPPKFYMLQKQYNITHAMLPISINERHLPLARMLYHDPEWSLIFINGSEVIFTNDSNYKANSIDIFDDREKRNVLSRIEKEYPDFTQRNHAIKNVGRLINLIDKY
jgi:hypothetical protein